jgi:hypothetical protein
VKRKSLIISGIIALFVSLLIVPIGIWFNKYEIVSSRYVRSFYWESNSPFWSMILSNYYDNMLSVILFWLFVFAVSLFIIYKCFENKTNIDTKNNINENDIEKYKLVKIPSFKSSDIENEISSRKNGLDDGQNNLPSQDATCLSKTEKEIISCHEKFIGRAKNFINKSLNDILLSIQKITKESPDAFYINIKNAPKNEFYKYIIGANQELMRYRSSERKALRDLNRFRQDNQLLREAVYPESKIYHCALVMLIIIIEATINAYFFAQGNDLGLLGGWLQAGIVSILNVSLSFIVGLSIIKEFNHVKVSHRVFAFFGTTICFIILSAFHWMVAHYRDALAFDPDNAYKLALTNFWHPLVSVDAYLLALCGMIITIISTTDGFLFDDRYPGYGKIDRAHKKKEKEYIMKDKEIRAKRVEIQNNAESKIGMHLSSTEDNIKILKELLNNAYLIFGQIEQTDRQSIETTLTCINSYRAANRSVRTENIPEFFNKDPEIKSH